MLGNQHAFFMEFSYISFYFIGDTNDLTGFNFYTKSDYVNNLFSRFSTPTLISDFSLTS